MNKKYLSRRALLVQAALLAGLELMAIGATHATGHAATVTVTAVAKKNAPPPPITKEDAQVFQGKERMQVVDWTRGQSLFLALLIDDSLSSEVANQWNDLKALLNAQSASTYIAVAYNRNGAAMVAQDFTNDHALAVKALRIPVGDSGAFSSPYLALQDWLKRWPNRGGDRRSTIMITSGIDYFRGGFDPIDPNLDTTIEHAQKENVNVWTIYYPDAGHGGGYFRTFNAQGNLTRLSEETGAESYSLGFERAVSLKPYFEEIREHLNHQYLLTFEAKGGGKKGKFDRVRVTTEIPNVEFLTPSEVFLPTLQ
jgi:hypothetical protein